jgi:hypothetical protein
MRVKNKAAGKNKWTYPSTSPILLHGVYRHNFNFSGNSGFIP